MNLLRYGGFPCLRLGQLRSYVWTPAWPTLSLKISTPPSVPRGRLCERDARPQTHTSRSLKFLIHVQATVSRDSELMWSMVKCKTVLEWSCWTQISGWCLQPCDLGLLNRCSHHLHKGDNKVLVNVQWKLLPIVITVYYNNYLQMHVKLHGIIRLCGIHKYHLFFATNCLVSSLVAKILILLRTLIVTEPLKIHTSHLCFFFKYLPLLF